MENLEIKATKFTPRISFDCERNILEITGESYPENAADFYTPVFFWLETYIEQLTSDKSVMVTIELSYFNSSSSKILLDLFDLLDDAAKNGKQIAVNWIYEEDDEETLEFGEEFQEDFEFVKINLVQKDLPGD